MAQLDLTDEAKQRELAQNEEEEDFFDEGNKHKLRASLKIPKIHSIYMEFIISRVLNGEFNDL